MLFPHLTYLVLRCFVQLLSFEGLAQLRALCRSVPVGSGREAQQNGVEVNFKSAFFFLFFSIAFGSSLSVTCCCAARSDNCTLSTSPKEGQ